MPKPTLAKAPAPATPVVAKKPAASGTVELTEVEKSQIGGADMDSMVAQATAAAQNTHETQINQAISTVESTQAKAAVIPAPAPTVLATP
jgi:hypothetical protein